jgi:hypothetical protein
MKKIMLSMGVALIGILAFKTSTLNNVADAKTMVATANIIDSTDNNNDTITHDNESDFGGNIEFYTALLKGIGANATPEKIKFLEAWRRGEGGHAKNNPFNTSKNVPGEADTKYNSHGVRNYPDLQTGLEATIATLKLSYYRDLVDSLRKDDVTAKEIARCASLKKWGTGDNVKKVLATGKVNVPAEVVLVIAQQWYPSTLWDA